MKGLRCYKRFKPLYPVLTDSSCNLYGEHRESASVQRHKDETEKQLKDFIGDFKLLDTWGDLHQTDAGFMWENIQCKSRIDCVFIRRF